MTPRDILSLTSIIFFCTAVCMAANFITGGR